MKVSEIVKNIVEEANVKFDVNLDHINDFASVGMTYDCIGYTWQVWLQMPTLEALERNITDDVDIDYEYSTLCFTQSNNLIAALKELLQKVKELDA